MSTETQNPSQHDVTVDVGANDVDYKKAIGADDSGLLDNAVEAIKGMAGKVANKLDPLTEQYAGLFKTGLRTPVMRKPSDYGMASRRRGSPRWTACRWRRGSSRPTRTSCSSSITR